MKTFQILVEEFYSGDVYFDLDTDIAYYNAILRKPEYTFWTKGVLGKVKYMTPDEYFIACGKLQHTTPEEQISNVDKSLALKYKDKMVDGEKFPMPLIDNITKRQEGRHRSFAAKQIDPHMKIPILFVFNANASKTDIIEGIKNGDTYDQFKHLCQVYNIPYFQESWYNKIKNNEL